MRGPRPWISPCLALMMALAPACAPSDGARRYPLSGKIQGVDLVDRELLIEHEEIKDFMPAMTMPFRMRDPEGLLAGWRGLRIEKLRRGDVITGTLVVKDSESWIEHVSVVRYEPPPVIPTAPPKESRVGEAVVDVALEDQDGEVFHLSDFRGRVLALTFIYTRCPLPDFCPRIMKNFQLMDEEIEKDPVLRTRARLLSISFDVDFDRPEVLRAFGSAFVKDRGQGPFARWRLATGSKEAIDRIGRFYGLVFFPEGGTFAHSLVTAIVGPDGKLVKEMSGNDWSIEEAITAMRESVSPSS